MKREILFRGKCIRTDKWVFGYLSNKDVISTDKGRLKVIPETVSQFTGLTDKNGVNIFEGDKTKDGVIEFYCGSFIENNEKHGQYVSLCQISSNDETKCDLEIIGNIHE